MSYSHVGEDNYDETLFHDSETGYDIVRMQSGKPDHIALYDGENDCLKPVPADRQEQIVELLEVAGLEGVRFPRSFRPEEV